MKQVNKKTWIAKSEHAILDETVKHRLILLIGLEDLLAIGGDDREISSSKEERK